MGNMAPLSEKKARVLQGAGVEIFTEGEEVELKGSKFKVGLIHGNAVTLELLPQ